MTMNCDAVARLTDEWRSGARTDRHETLAAAEHLCRCRRCAEAHGILVPFLLRDAGEPATGPGQIAAGLERGIMDRVELISGTARRPGPARREIRAALSIAAAAFVVLVAAGALFLTLRPDLTGRLLTVTFVLEAPEARSVAVVGDFNDWRSEGYELARRSGDGAWTITLRLRRDTTYTYCFLVDGREWVPDPRAPESVDDGFGGVDSVLRL